MDSVRRFFAPYLQRALWNTRRNGVVAYRPRANGGLLGVLSHLTTTGVRTRRINSIE